MVEITEYSRERAEPLGFTESIWPQVEAHRQSIRRIFLLRYPTGGGYAHDKVVNDHPRIIIRRHGAGAVELAALDEVPPDVAEILKYGCFYNGHLNVVFELEEAAPEPRQLLSCFDTKQVIRWTHFEALADADRVFLRGFLERLLTTKSAFAFAHDGEPLYLFRGSATR